MNTVSVLVTLLVSSIACDGMPYQPIPGLGYIGHGFNLMTAQPASEVLLNTYNFSNNTWTNNVTGQTYILPDAVGAIPLSFSNFTNSSTTFEGVLDFQAWAYHQYHWHSGFLGMDSHTRTTYQFLERYFRQDQSFSYSSLNIEFLRLEAIVLPPFVVLTPTFLAALNGLPSSCCDNSSDYAIFQEFIAAYGHGWIDVITLGGTLTAQTWFPKCFLNVTSVSWVTEQSSWSFLGIIGGGHGSSQHESNSDANFTNCISSTFEYFGGSFIGLRPNQWAAWAPTIFANPFPVQLHVKRYSMLLNDTNQSRALELAIEKSLFDAQVLLNQTEFNMSQSDPHIPSTCCTAFEALAEEGER